MPDATHVWSIKVKVRAVLGEQAIKVAREQLAGQDWTLLELVRE
jgi:hypothetical protein